MTSSTGKVQSSFMMTLTRRTAALVVERIDGFTGTAILAGRRTARHVLVLAILTRKARIAVTSGKMKKKRNN